MTLRIIPEPYSPGDAIKEELQARGWKQVDLAQILGVRGRVVHDLIHGKRRINAKIAQALGDALGIEPEEWMRLQSIYDLTLESMATDDTKRKRKLWDVAPIRLMTNRGWIVETRSVEFLEAQVLQFHRTDDLGGIEALPHAARQSSDHPETSKEQRTWLRRAMNLAESYPLETKYSARKNEQLLDELSELMTEPEEVRHVPTVLRKYGIRFLIVEHLPASKIDGVCFWLGDDPVISLSLRFNRIDWFWFTLAHELGHVVYGHGKEHPSIDASLVGRDAEPSDHKPNEERKADAFANRYLIDEAEIDDFITRYSPSFSNSAIVGFAGRIGVHPGIVVGRLQHLGEILYSRGRQMLAPVRDCIADSALTDGWGHTVSV